MIGIYGSITLNLLNMTKKKTRRCDMNFLMLHGHIFTERVHVHVKKNLIHSGGPHLTLVTSVQPQATLHSFWLRPRSYFLHHKTSDSFTSSYVDIYWYWDYFFFLKRTRKRTHIAKTESSLQNLLHNSVSQLNDTITQPLFLLLNLLEKHGDSYFSTSHCPLLCWCPDVYVPHAMLLILI